MTKTYFQKTYHLNRFLVISLTYSFGFSFASKLLSELLLFQSSQTETISKLLAFIIDKVSILLELSNKVSIVLLLSLVVLVGIELYQRIVNDLLLNYWKSIYQTIRLKAFLKQELTYEPIETDGNQTANYKNPVLIQFNKAVRWLVVDIRKDNVTVLLKAPRTQQALKLFKEMEDDIREEISNRNPDYYFSSPEREGSDLWFIGTKR